ncbi:MAG: AIR synthase-related protein, partial [Halobacteriaceae archaeon]
IVGGHSEYNPDLQRPLLSLTSIGIAERFIPTHGASPGDRVLLTTGVGIEGTAIIASDFRATALERGVNETKLDRAKDFFEDISVLPDASILWKYATAMHDPTEGGLVNGLYELASAAGVVVAVERNQLVIRDETQAICEAMGVDPLRILGSGALVATVPPDDVDAALTELADAGIAAADIGTVNEGDQPSIVVNGERFKDPVQDDLYTLWE